MTNDIFADFPTETDLEMYIYLNPEWYNTTFKNSLSAEKDTVLHLACRWGFNGTAMRLMREKFEVNSRNIANMTPLHYASARCILQVCLDLVYYGADIDAVTYEGMTPLFIAIQYGAEENAEYFASRTNLLDGRYEIGRTALHLAAQKGFTKTCYELLFRGIPVNAWDNMQNTPLHLAVRGGHLETVELLVKNGADFNLADVNDLQPWMMARNARDYKMLTLLKNLGDPNIKRSHFPKVKDQSLPEFRFHLNPLQTGSLVAEEGECECCENFVNYLYRGPVYSEEEILSLCPWCIASGNAARKFSATFTSVESGSNKIFKLLINEVEKNTLGFAGWQSERWLTCCDQPCEYLGKGGLAEMEALGVDAKESLSQSIIKEAGYALNSQEAQDYLNILMKEEDPTAYFFRCLTCLKYHAYSDCT